MPTTAFSQNPRHAVHQRPGHVERPERAEAVLALLQSQPVWDALRHLEPAAVEDDDLLLIHTADYVQRLTNAAEAGGAQLDVDTYCTRDSLDAARQGLGALLACTRSVLDGEADNAFACVRPPGHHATPERAMGFCLLSNVAIAARWAARHFGAERALILDFDVHHGNGTQDALYDDPNALYVSLHQSPLYPGTGAVTERGGGRGRGATVNLPLPPRTADDGYLAALRRVVAPLARRFRPDVVFLSAGYDAHWRDPLGGMHLSVVGFAEVVREAWAWADALCDGRLVALLEGGYDAQALAHSVAGTLEVLQDPQTHVEDPFGPAPGGAAQVGDLVTEMADYFGVG